MTDVVETILVTCREIKNSRDIYSVFHHLKGEVDELADELALANSGNKPGPDGVLGEAVDVMLRAIDAVYINDPTITTEDIMAKVTEKLVKWKRLYGNA